MADRPEQDPGRTYLDEAADQLRKARADNEARAAEVETLEAARDTAGAAKIRAEVNARRLEIAEGFAVLAAIEAGCAGITPGHLPGREG